MHSSDPSNTRPGRAFQLFSTRDNNTSSNGQAHSVSITYGVFPELVPPSVLHHTTNTRAAACTPIRMRRAVPATTPPLTSQISYVPNHPYMQTENKLLLRDTVGKGKRRYVTATGSVSSSPTGHSGTHTVDNTPLQTQSNSVPAGQCRPPFDPDYDSCPVTHHVPPVRSLRKYTPDFHFLNQCTINPAIRNVKDFSIYRKTLPVKEFCPRNTFPEPQPLPSELDHQHTYGFKKVEKESFRAVLEHRYALKKMVHLAEKYERERVQQLEDAALKKIRMTKAARGHARGTCTTRQSNPIAAATREEALCSASCYGENVHTVAPFKIKRFLHVPPRTCSHRGICPLNRPASPHGGTRN